MPIPESFIDAYRRREKGIRDEEMGQLSQVGVLAGLQEKMRAEQQEQQFRAGMRPGMTNDEMIRHASQFIGAKDLATFLQSGDLKREQTKATSERAQATIAFAARKHLEDLAVKQQNANSTEERNYWDQQIGQYRMEVSKAFADARAGEVNYGTSTILPTMRPFTGIPSRTPSAPPSEPQSVAPPQQALPIGQGGWAARGPMPYEDLTELERFFVRSLREKGRPYEGGTYEYGGGAPATYKYPIPGQSAQILPRQENPRVEELLRAAQAPHGALATLAAPVAPPAGVLSGLTAQPQGVLSPAAPAAQVAPAPSPAATPAPTAQMPSFTGSPRQIAESQNKWLLQEAKQVAGLSSAKAPEEVINAIVEGRMAIPGGFALRAPYWQDAIARVAQKDPNFDATKYGARAAARRTFASGPEARNVTALNTVIGHLGTLDEMATALEGKDLRVANMVINRIRTELGDPRVQNFDTAKQAVAEETMRVFRQVGASEAEARAWGERIHASGSPQQLRGVIATLGELLESRVNAIAQQFERTVRQDQNPARVDPANKEKLDRMIQRGNLPGDRGTGGWSIRPAN